MFLRRLALMGLFLLLPVGVYLVNSDVAFGPLYHDCWLYHGYFLDLPGHLRAFHQHYYSSRLTLTFPGWLAYQCLPPLAANHTLHLGLYLLGIVSLYVTVRDTVSPRAALVAALVLGGHTYFHRAVSSDYFDGYAVAYFLLTLALLTRAAFSDHWRGLLCLAGMSAVALVVVNLTLVLLLAPLAGHALLVNRAGRKISLLRGAGWLFLGAGGMIVALCLLSKLLGGTFWFLSPSLRFASSFGVNGNPFKRAVSEWLPQASWLILPVAVALGGLAHLALRRTRERTLILWYQLQLVGLLALLATLECTRRFALLQMWFYAGALLLPATLLALAGQWKDPLEAMTARAYGVLVLGLILLPILLAGQGISPESIPTVWVLGLVVLVAVILPRCQAGLVPVLLALVLLGVADAGQRRHFRLEEGMARPTAESLRLARDAEMTGRRKEVFLAMHRAMRTICVLDPHYRGAFWFDIDEPLGLLFDNIACLHCWKVTTLVNNTFPEVKPLGSPIQPRMRLLLLSSDPRLLCRLQKAIKPLGVSPRLLARRETGTREMGFTVYLVETRVHQEGSSEF